MMAQPLPYDMGGIGDLLKHGVLAEFTQWWCQSHTTPLRFVDPFGGRPWVEPPVPRVAERVKALAGGALLHRPAAPSGAVLWQWASCPACRTGGRTAGRGADVRSRSCRTARFGHLRPHSVAAPRLWSANGFSILTTEIDADLVLIDPFAHFLREDAPLVLPQVSTVSRRMAIVVFVLIQDPMNVDGRRYTTLKGHHRPRVDPPLSEAATHGREGGVELRV